MWLTAWIHHRFWLVTSVVVALGFALRLPGVQFEGSGPNSFRQAQTSLLIREFADNGFDLRSPVPVLGPPYFIPLEFPLFQGLAAIIMEVTGLPAMAAGGVLSLLFFAVTGMLLAILMRKWFGTGTAVLTVVLLQVVPFGWAWAPDSLIEFLPVAAMLAGTLTLESWVRSSRSMWLLVASGAVVVAFLVKPTTAVVLSPLLIAPLTDLHTIDRSGRVRGVIAGLVPLGVGLLAAVAWTRYADSVKAASPLTEFLTSGALRAWNFGFPSQRLLPNEFITYGENLAAITGHLVLFLATATAALVFTRRRWHALAMAAPVFLAFFIFTNLFVVHQYYVAAIIAPAVGVMALGVVGIARHAREHNGQLIAVGGLSSVLVVSAWSTDAGSAAYHYYFRFPIGPISAEIRASTDEGSGLILLGCDWDSRYLYEADRRGLMIRSSEDTPIPEEWIGTELQYVAWCNEDETTPDLPPGYSLEPVSENVARIVRR